MTFSGVVLNWLPRLLAQWIGDHWFHLNGVAAKWHGGGSGDTALDYVRILCFVMAAALVVGGIAAKAGLFKVVLVALLAAKKFIIIGMAAIAGYFKKLFKRKKKEPAAEVRPRDFEPVAAPSFGPGGTWAPSGGIRAGSLAGLLRLKILESRQDKRGLPFVQFARTHQHRTANWTVVQQPVSFAGRFF